MSKIRYCGIVRCPNNQGVKDADCVVFKPTNPEVINKWKIALENLGLEYSSYRPMICKLHFSPKDFVPGKNKLRPEAVPSIGHIPTVDEMSSNFEQSSSPIEDSDNKVFPLEMVEIKLMPKADIDMESSIQDDNKMWQTTNHPDSHLENRPRKSNDQCTECTKNIMKMKFLEKNNENLRKKYKQLLMEVSELRKSQNRTSFDEDCAMTTENELEDSHEEWCEVCWKQLLADDVQQHICVDNMKVIRCEYCSVLLKSTVELRVHLGEANHPDTKMHKCEVCTLEYPSALLLMFHQSSELGHSQSTENLKTVQCYICGADFDSNPVMQKHIRDHLLVQKCELCNEKLTFHELGDHLCDGQESMHCEYCNEPFNATIKLIEHLNSKHTDDGILYKCGKCSKFFKMTLLKDIHEKYHPDIPKPYRCGQCFYRFTTEYGLNDHTELYHENKNGFSFVCEKCGKSFKTERNLANHSSVHNERKFQCPDCPATFKRKHDVRAHSSIHQKIRYKCNQCEVTFTRKCALGEHLSLIHQSKAIERKFACKLCPLKFQKNNKLAAHMRSHTGEKPFTCAYCDQKYAYKGDLNKHLKTHVGENIYSCEQCGQGFRLPTEFRRHTFEHYKKDKEKSNEPPVNANGTK